MKFLDIIATASSNMFRSKLRTTLTIVAIFIGAFTLTLTNGLGAGISSYIDKQLGNIGAKDVMFIQANNDASGKPSDQPKKYDPNKRTTSIASEGNRSVTVLTDKDLSKIKAISGIKSVKAYIGGSIDYISGKSGEKYVGSINEYLEGENFSLDAGSLLNNASTKFEVMVPSTYISSLGYSNAADAIGKTVKLGVTNGLGKQSEIEASITAVQQKSLLDNNAINLNTALLTEVHKLQNVGLPSTATADYQMAIARFDSTMPADKVKDLKDRLKKAGYNGTTIDDQIGTFKSVIAGIVAVLNGFAIIALLAASFGIINTLLMSVQERTKEIGLMKAMGMGGGKIFLLFSGEAVMLGFWGSLIGSAVAIGAGQIINKVVLNTFLKDLVGLQLLKFSPTSVAVIVGIVMGIAFLAGTLPAIRAARQNPIDSLRYE